jgi:hypothetical protein
MHVRTLYHPLQRCAAQCPVSLEAFLDIIYTGYTLRITTLDIAKSAHELAHQCMAPPALAFTTRYIRNFVTPTNAKDVLEWAERLGFTDVSEWVKDAKGFFQDGESSTDEAACVLNHEPIRIEDIGQALLDSAQGDASFADLELVASDGPVRAHRAMLGLVNADKFGEGGGDTIDATQFTRVRLNKYFS